MKYTVEIIVDVPRAEFIEKMDNAENMKHWQKGLVDYKFLTEDKGKVGSKMELNYLMGKRKMSMVETIVEKDLPRIFHMHYDAKGLHNIQKNFFEEVDEKHTKWISEAEFQFQSFGMKIMGALMPGLFKKQSLKYLNDFKAFAETGASVLPSKD